MNISQRTIQALGSIITGDGNISPYRSGPKLVAFFNEHGCNLRYGSGFSSRWLCAEDQLRELNGTQTIKKIIEEALHPKHFINTDFEVSIAVDYLNKYLVYDGIKIIKNGLAYSVINSENQVVSTEKLIEKFSTRKGSHCFILEQNDKCREKLDSGDYDGAITNARSMVEAVFEEILLQKGVKFADCDGDLNRLYKEIKKYFNLDASKEGTTETIKQILSGLNSIVTGIAGISNKMGDRHARKYKPEKHHALLAINTAYALCEFLVSSHEYQNSIQKKNSQVIS